MEALKRDVHSSNSSQNVYKNVELTSINLDEDIFNLKCNIELRTSQFQRLITEMRNQAARGSGGTIGNQGAKESIFSSNNYGMSTLTEAKAEIETERRSKNNRRSTGGPKVKTKKPYCSLI